MAARILHWAYCSHCNGDGCRWCNNTGEVETWCPVEDDADDR